MDCFTEGVPKNNKNKTLRVSAIVLAGGSGSRMGSDLPKQFLPLGNWPVLCHSLYAFECFAPVREVVLVAKEDWVPYCRTEIVEKYGFTKVRRVVPGGAQRYDSVYEGLKALKGCEYVMIHDGARPFLDEGILQRNLDAVLTDQAAVTGMPSKDTVKLSDDAGFAVHTPPRDHVWIIQTPQTFSYPLIREAYEKLFQAGAEGITDDTMVAERMLGVHARLVEGSYRNLKITTPEDLILARALIKNADENGSCG